jgi:superfamily II DNA or RNA helicase
MKVLIFQINQIIMRPTESAIIFIQQLGRGLRKFDGKTT